MEIARADRARQIRIRRIAYGIGPAAVVALVTLEWSRLEPVMVVERNECGVAVALRVEGG